MRFSLLTYNVLFNRAFFRLEQLIKKEHPDIICLQEVDTREENLKELEKFNYRLADFANCFIESGKIWGIVTYYNPDKFEFLNSKPIPLIGGFYELIKSISLLFKIKGVRRTILKTNFHFKPSGKDITIYNIHLSAIGFNNLRLKQINSISFDNLAETGSVILTGDFNFPVERKRLERIMNRYDLKEATSNLYYTVRYPLPAKYKFSFFYRLFSKIVKRFWAEGIKLDYIFYRGLQNRSTKRLDENFSDHFPIVSEFEL